MPRRALLATFGLLLLAACSSTPHRDEVDPRPPPAATPPDLSACDGLEGLDGAFCRVQARLHWARQRRDVVLVSCLNGPYQRLVTIRQAQPDGGAGEGGVGDVLREREIMRLESEAEHCD